MDNERFIKWEKIPNYGDHMEIEEFAEDVKNGMFIDYDGSRNYATESAMSDKEFRPSTFEVKAPYTHVVWFNR